MVSEPIYPKPTEPKPINPGPFLYVFSGLPGTGKTTIAKLLSQKLRAAYLRIDTVEQGLRDLCDYEVVAEGYRLAHKIAKDNLQNRVSVVADSCNPVQISRDEWVQVAMQSNAMISNIYLYCSNKNEHEARINNRRSDIEGLKLPSWQKVLEREFEPWETNEPNLITIDTSNRTPTECLQILAERLNAE